MGWFLLANVAEKLSGRYVGEEDGVFVGLWRLFYALSSGSIVLSSTSFLFVTFEW